MLDEGRILQYLHKNFTIHGGTRSEEKIVPKQIRERRKYGVVANLNLSRYDIVRKVVEESGFTIQDKDDLSDAMLIWTDNFLPFEKIMTLKPYQRLNHFPGMIEICRKDFLAKNFMRMNRIEPEEYNFLPKSWVLPQEHGFFLNYVRRAAERDFKPSFILKPANGAMGHGIRLYRNGESVPANPPNGLPCVIQEYVQNPLLIDGFKCDLRVYVLITSCDPLRVFIYNEGLVRLSAEKYVEPNEPNGESIYIHLTNYAVNKRHACYVTSTNEMDGSKRSFTFLDQHLRDTRNVDPHVVWRSIRDLIIKTMALVTPHLLHSYRMCRRGQHRVTRTHRSVETASKSQRSNSSGTSREAGDCSKPTGRPRVTESRWNLNVPVLQSSFFEILGFDILLDSDLKPWLLEVNRSPSFNGDSELDRRVKHGLLTDALRLLNIRHVDKTNSEREQHLFSVHRLYRSNTVLPGARIDHSDVAPHRLFRQPSTQRLRLEPGVERQLERLHLQLSLLRRRSALDFFEYHNSGNWCLIFPTDDRSAQKKFATLLLQNFAQFHNGKIGDMQAELEETYLRQLTEDDILGRVDKLLRKHAEVSLQYKKYFSQDSDLFQVDDYDVTSSDENSSETESTPHQSSKTFSPASYANMSRTLVPNSVSETLRNYRKSSVAQRKHPVKRNIRSCGKDKHGTIRHGASRSVSVSVVPWRI